MKVDSLELVLEKTEPGKEKLKLYLGLAAAYLNNDPNKALEYAMQAYELSKDIDSEEEILHSTIKLAEAYNNLSEFALANNFALMAQDYALEAGDPIKIGQVKILLANLHLTLYDLETSMGLFYESLKLFEEIESKQGISTALNGIGIIYHEQNNFDKALECFLKCYDINKEIGNHAVMSATLNNIASAYSRDKQFEKSIRYYMEAIEMNKKFDNKYLEATGYYNLGESYMDLGNHEEAIKYFYKAIQISSELEDPESTTNIKTSIAEYYLGINELDSSIMYANEAFSMADQYQFKQFVARAAAILHHSYEKNGNFEDAYKFAIIQSNMKDSLKIEQSIQQIANLDLKYRIEKEEQQRQMVREKEKSRQIILGVILFSIFIIIVIALIARQRITVKNMKLEKSKVEGKLELRNKELALNVMTLLKKNDMLTSISEELIDLKKSAVKSETKDAINRISKKIKKSSESEIWKEFELRFKEVHAEFYETLTRDYPDLSPGDQRLCALLRLNMSSKEISELTGQSINALEKARYRLRKKLQISDPSVNLVNYLSGL
nr:tetratricopeptide repeat protein [Bacteroidota bacterium]